MTKRPERTELTRRTLIEAFWKIFAVRPLASITAKEVAAKAGYNRATFYQHFAGIRELAAAAEAELLPKPDEMPPPIPTEGSLGGLMSLYRERFERIHRLLGEDGDPGFARRLKDGLKGSIARLTAGQEADPELDLFLEYELSGLIGLLNYAADRGFDLDDPGLMALAYRAMDGQAAARARAAMSGEPKAADQDGERLAPPDALK